LEKKISKTLLYSLKREAIKKRGQSEGWLDQSTQFQFIERYRKRIEELELVQKNLLKTY